ncbi:pyridoxamine 5'-phosphate oxidase [Geodermatophilus sp. Leaf369]|uniref:pyridoxamine 5'-phosphate oxidase family protein n=1 Tax=Geodermatophilus sp. Leaf369 TaxID=1736354 RepID=UPI0007018784|nr:pyridoxamine 5'-phosphate oxidase family protein [Geodermatophilus sp. Leaf369]KQS58439.1 pyridoxamine 5'-phosphate oxidase [Geodermatophilus sp. Leaf369]
MTTFFTDSQRGWQDHFESRPLADRLEAAIVADTLDEGSAAFIASRDFFFLSTVDGEGRPTVSYKGGPQGVVAVLDERTLAFPHYDGNGMFLSMGNASETGRIGLLFIDLETPNRVRVQATASVSADDELLARWPGASLVTRATVDEVFPNCGRYVHVHERVRASEYVPDDEGQAPRPSWKRLDVVQDVLPDAGRTADEGGTITFEEYVGKVQTGTS